MGLRGNRTESTRRNRWAGLLVSLSLIAAACGTNSGGQASPGAEGTGTGGTSPGAASPDAASPGGGGASGEITAWAMGNEGVLLGDFVDRYAEENPDAQVDITPVDWGIARDRLLTAIGGNQTPDVSQMGTDMMGEFIETGALAPLAADIDGSRFFEGAFNTGVAPDGTAYSVPWYVETRVLYYRTDIAEEAGITEPPANWDELKAMAVAMQDQGGAEWGISLGTMNWQEYLPFLWSNGGDVMTDGEFTLDSPEAVEALEFYDSFFEEGLSPNQVPEGFDITPAFVQGSHPMFFSGPWHLGLIAEAGGDGFEDKWAVAPMPAAPGGDTGVSFVGGGNLVVYTDSEEPDLAWDFVQWMTQPETQLAWYEEATVLPSDRSAWDDPALADDPNVQVFGDQLENTRAQPAIPTWAEVASAINDQLERVTVGDQDAQGGAEAMQQEAQSIGTE